MANEKLQKSLATGPHHLLQQMVGEWEGTTRTWFEPGKLADESSWRGTIRSLWDGRFIQHEYSGNLEGKPLRGMAVYGYYLAFNKFEAVWMDDFHMGTGIMHCEGDATADGFSMLGSYRDPGGGPAWGWRTEVRLVNADTLVITMYNITPEGEEMKAVETQYSRRK